VKARDRRVADRHARPDVLDKLEKGFAENLVKSTNSDLFHFSSFSVGNVI
jgi:hypothetical protein